MASKFQDINVHLSPLMQKRLQTAVIQRTPIAITVNLVKEPNIVLPLTATQVNKLNNARSRAKPMRSKKINITSEQLSLIRIETGAGIVLHHKALQGLAKMEGLGGSIQSNTGMNTTATGKTIVESSSSVPRTQRSVQSNTSMPSDTNRPRPSKVSTLAEVTQSNSVPEDVMLEHAPAPAQKPRPRKKKVVTTGGATGWLKDAVVHQMSEGGRAISPQEASLYHAISH